MSSITEPPPPEPLIVEVRAEAEHLAGLRDLLTSWLAEAGACEDLAGRIVLAMNEAATNAMTHAYLNCAAGTVRVTAEREQGRMVKVTIADSGRWKPARPTEGNGGRGVLMMQECVDQVRIDRSPEGTTVTLRSQLRVPTEDELAAAPETTPRHELDVGMMGEAAVARLSGDVPVSAAVQLRRELLTATCGGVVPLIVDLAEVGPVTEGLMDALSHVARAANGTGERVVLRTHPRRPLPELGTLRTAVGDAVEIVPVNEFG